MGSGLSHDSAGLSVRSCCSCELLRQGLRAALPARAFLGQRAQACTSGFLHMQHPFFRAPPPVEVLCAERRHSHPARAAEKILSPCCRQTILRAILGVKKAHHRHSASAHSSWHSLRSHQSTATLAMLSSRSSALLPQANGDGEMLAGNHGEGDSGRQRQQIVAPSTDRRSSSSSPAR